MKSAACQIPDIRKARDLHPHLYLHLHLGRMPFYASGWMKITVKKTMKMRMKKRSVTDGLQALGALGMISPFMRTPPTITAYLALGANLGDRGANIRHAAEKLAETPGIRVGRMSELIETQPQGMAESAPAFLNAALEVQTNLGAHALLQRMLEIEREMGRQRRLQWESRPIDLDLLLFGDHILSSEELIVPHPLMHERRFVLEPLAQIAPQVVHPTLQMTIAGLLDALHARGPERR